MWVEKCYVNLEWVIEWWDSDLTYLWKNNGEVFSYKKNPKWFWVDRQKNEIQFLAMQWEEMISQDTFMVNITTPDPTEGEKAQERVELEPILFAEELTKEKAKISFTQNFLLLKYDGLRISWKAPEWSQIEIYSEWKRILTGKTDIKWKYRLVSKNFTQGSYSFDTKFIVASWEEIFIENSGNTDISISDRAYWFTTQKKSRTHTIKLPQLIVKAEAANQEEVIIEQTSLWMNVFLSIIITLSILFWWAHLILWELSVYRKNLHVLLYKETFSIKQRVNIIL